MVETSGQPQVKEVALSKEERTSPGASVGLLAYFKPSKPCQPPAHVKAGVEPACDEDEGKVVVNRPEELAKDSGNEESKVVVDAPDKPGKDCGDDEHTNAVRKHPRCFSRRFVRVKEDLALQEEAVVIDGRQEKVCSEGTMTSYEGVSGNSHARHKQCVAEKPRTLNSGEGTSEHLQEPASNKEEGTTPSLSKANSGMCRLQHYWSGVKVKPKPPDKVQTEPASPEKLSATVVYGSTVNNLSAECLAQPAVLSSSSEDEDEMFEEVIRVTKLAEKVVLKSGGLKSGNEGFGDSIKIEDVKCEEKSIEVVGKCAKTSPFPLQENRKQKVMRGKKESESLLVPCDEDGGGGGGGGESLLVVSDNDDDDGGGETLRRRRSRDRKRVRVKESHDELAVEVSQSDDECRIVDSKRFVAKEGQGTEEEEEEGSLVLSRGGLPQRRRMPSRSCKMKKPMVEERDCHDNSDPHIKLDQATPLKSKKGTSHAKSGAPVASIFNRANWGKLAQKVPPEVPGSSGKEENEQRGNKSSQRRSTRKRSQSQAVVSSESGDDSSDDNVQEVKAKPPCDWHLQIGPLLRPMMTAATQELLEPPPFPSVSHIHQFADDAASKEFLSAEWALEQSKMCKDRQDVCFDNEPLVMGTLTGCCASRDAFRALWSQQADVQPALTEELVLESLKVSCADLDGHRILKRYQSRLSNAGGRITYPEVFANDQDTRAEKPLPNDTAKDRESQIKVSPSTKRKGRKRSSQDGNEMTKKRRRSSRLRLVNDDECVVTSTDQPMANEAIALLPTAGGVLGCKPWTVVFEPHTASQVLGSRKEAKKLVRWLQAWKKRRAQEDAAHRSTKMKKKKRKKPQEDHRPEDDENDEWCPQEDDFVRAPHRLQRSCYSDGESDEDELCSAVLLTGPHGCGKSAMVHACAKQLGYEVFEVNAAMCRSGKHILALLQEATQSHQVSQKALASLRPTSEGIGAWIAKGPSTSVSKSTERKPEEKQAPASKTESKKKAIAVHPAFASFIKTDKKTTSCKETPIKSSPKKPGKESGESRKRSQRKEQPVVDVLSSPDHSLTDDATMKNLKLNKGKRKSVSESASVSSQKGKGMEGEETANATGCLKKVKHSKPAKKSEKMVSTSSISKDNNQQSNSSFAGPSVILFEEVDIIFEEDRGFWAAIASFLDTSKRPIIMTSLVDCVPQGLGIRHLLFTLNSPPERLIAAHLQLMALAAGVPVSAEDAAAAVTIGGADLRKCISQLHLWLAGIADKCSTPLPDAAVTGPWPQSFPVHCLWAPSTNLSGRSILQKFSFALSCLSSAQLSTSTRLGLLEDVCGSLEAAHSVGLDLSLANLSSLLPFRYTFSLPPPLQDFVDEQAQEKRKQEEAASSSKVKDQSSGLLHVFAPFDSSEDEADDNPAEKSEAERDPDGMGLAKKDVKPLSAEVISAQRQVGEELDCLGVLVETMSVCESFQPATIRRAPCAPLSWQPSSWFAAKEVASLKDELGCVEGEDSYACALAAHMFSLAEVAALLTVRERLLNRAEASEDDDSCLCAISSKKSDNFLAQVSADQSMRQLYDDLIEGALLPYRNTLQHSAVTLDYLPALRMICHSETLRAAARTKRRFTHHMDNWSACDDAVLASLSSSYLQ